MSIPADRSAARWWSSSAAIAELERNLIIERVRAGMRRAKLEGRRIGREPLDVDRPAVLRDRARGLSLAELAKQYRVSRSSVCRVLRDAQVRASVQRGRFSAPATP